MAISRNKIIAQAQKLTAKGQLEKAIAEYKKLLKADANDIRTWLKVGDLYTRVGARKEATETYLRVADKYTKNGFHLKAVAVYKQILKLDPTMIDVFQYLADSYIQLGLTSEALIQLEQLADNYQRVNRTDQMLVVLNQMAEIDPKNIATRLRIAEHLSKENRTLEAVEQFRLTCDELKKQKRTDDFLKVAERLLYHDSSQIEIARETASLYLERQMYKRALAKLQLCFVNEPRNLNTLEMLALTFQSLGQPDKAVSVLKEMALLLKEQGNEAWRERILEKILALDPANEMALEELGRRSSEAPLPLSPKDSSKAPAHAAAQIDSVDPKDPPAAGELTEAQMEEQIGQLLSEVDVLKKYDLKDRAISHLEKVLSLDYYNIDARERLKDILLDKDKQDEALEQLFFLADMFHETQPEGSIYYLHEVLRIDPENDQARRLIIELGGVMPEELAQNQTGTPPAPTTEDQQDEQELENAVAAAVNDELTGEGLIDVEQTAGIDPDRADDTDELSLEDVVPLQDMAPLDERGAELSDGALEDIAPLDERDADGGQHDTLLERVPPGQRRPVSNEDSEVVDDIATVDEDVLLLEEDSEVIGDIATVDEDELRLAADDEVLRDIVTSRGDDLLLEEDSAAIEEIGTIEDDDLLLDEDSAVIEEINDVEPQPQFLEEDSEVIEEIGEIDDEELVLEDDSEVIENLEEFGAGPQLLDEDSEVLDNFATLRDDDVRRMSASDPEPVQLQVNDIEEGADIEEVEYIEEVEEVEEVNDEGETTLLSAVDPDSFTMDIKQSMPPTSAPAFTESTLPREQSQPEPTDEPVDVLPEIDDELEEITFYLEQELYREAKGILDELLVKYPDDPRLLKIQSFIAENHPSELPSAMPPPVVDTVEDSSDEILTKAFPMDEIAASANAGMNELSPTRVKTAREVDTNDFATHYDLGIAYKEMGLYNDAVTEFTAASGDPKRTALCKTMIGLCLVSLNRVEESILVFKEGLQLGNIDEMEKLGLLYELGKAYEQTGNRSEALDCFEKISNENPEFADVAVRINSLGGNGGARSRGAAS